MLHLYTLITAMTAYSASISYVFKMSAAHNQVSSWQSCFLRLEQARSCLFNVNINAVDY